MVSVSLRSVFGQMASRMGDPEDAMYGDLSAVRSDMVRCMLEAAAASELEHRMGFKLRQRATPDRPRADYRNGYRKRTVQLVDGSVVIRLPRMRLSGFVPGFLRPRHRAIAEVDAWVEQALLCGVSRAELCRLMSIVTGFVPAPSVLAHVEATLDAKVRQFKERRLPSVYEYLYLDAAWVKDLIGRTTGRVCVLMAVGVTTDGRKEILGFERVQRESGSSWRGFLTRLVARGLVPDRVRLVVSDEHRGLLEAVPEVLGDVPHQLCWAHRMRNVHDAVAVAHRAEVRDGLRGVYKAASLTEADARLRAFCGRWGSTYPNLAAKLLGDARYLLACFSEPPCRREYLRTTNPIERTFREVRRWRRGCGAFADVKSCDRTFFKVSYLLNERWATNDLWYKRRNLTEPAQGGRTP